MTRNSEWFKGFFAGLYGQVLPTTFSAAQTLAHVRLVRHLLGLRKRQRVLDIPCGQGRLTIPLARAGMDMTGVDLTPGYIRQARRQASQAGVRANFLQADMRQIAFDGEFDAALNWFGSFGYFNREQNLRFLRRLLRALRPGGRVLIEGLNRSWVQRHFAAGSSEQIGPVVIDHEPRFNRRTGRLNDLWTLTRGRRIERHRISMQVFSGGEIRRLLRTAGFVDVELYGLTSLRLSKGPLPASEPLSPGSMRWIAVARRPDPMWHGRLARASHERPARGLVAY